MIARDETREYPLGVTGRQLAGFLRDWVEEEWGDDLSRDTLSGGGSRIGGLLRRYHPDIVQDVAAYYPKWVRESPSRQEGRGRGFQYPTFDHFVSNFFAMFGELREGGFLWPVSRRMDQNPKWSPPKAFLNPSRAEAEKWAKKTAPQGPSIKERKKEYAQKARSLSRWCPKTSNA